MKLVTNLCWITCLIQCKAVSIVCGAGLPCIERTKLEVWQAAPSLTCNVMEYCKLCVWGNNINLERHSSNKGCPCTKSRNFFKVWVDYLWVFWELHFYPRCNATWSFTSSETRADQTGRKLYVTRGKTNYTRHFYLNRIAKLWNSLPADILDFSASVYSIKQKVRQYLISNFEQSDVCSYHLICPCQNCHTI